MNKTNLVLFITDGHRTDGLGCYGNKILRTPNIDAFAAEGVRFTRSFCSHTVCMPTRASIFTGRYPHVHHVWANGVPLSKSEVTLPQLLMEHGYDTCAAGKLHFEPQEPYDQYVPIIEDTPYYGFQEVHLCENRQGLEYIRFIEENFPELSADARARAPSLPEEAHELHWITTKAIDFIENCARRGRPFFLSCSFAELVPPCHPPAGFAGMYRPEDMPPPKVKPGELAAKPPYHTQCYEGYVRRGKHPDEPTLRKLLAGYYDEIAFIDKQFGRLIAALKESGAWDDTVVLFTADHGLCLNDHYQWRHGPFLYDQVINVPMIWRVPGAAEGVVTDELAESVDISATVLDILGIEPRAGMQGRSLRPLIAGEAGARVRESVLVQDRESPELLARGIDPTGFSIIGVRTKEWKLIHYPGCPYGELYDLVNDPDEFVNLWADPGYIARRQEMEHLLLERISAAGDPLPERKYHW